MNVAKLQNALGQRKELVIRIYFVADLDSFLDGATWKSLQNKGNAIGVEYFEPKTLWGYDFDTDVSIVFDSFHSIVSDTTAQRACAFQSFSYPPLTRPGSFLSL